MIAKVGDRVVVTHGGTRFGRVGTVVVLDSVCRLVVRFDPDRFTAYTVEPHHVQVLGAKVSSWR